MTKFTESQRMFDSLFNKIIVILVMILFGKLIYNSFTVGFSYSTIFSLIILLFTIIVFVIFRVKTEVNQNGIIVQITPFNLYHKTFDWKEIQKVEVVKYSPLSEYGGWGYRRSKNGTAINPTGDKGLKIYFKNGTKLLIGTKKEEELKQFLKSIKK